MIEAGVPDYEVTTFQGVVAPAGTPREIVAKLNAAINEGLGSAEMRETITKLGGVPTLGTPEELGAFMAAQGAKWSAVAESREHQGGVTRLLLQHLRPVPVRVRDVARDVLLPVRAARLAS